MKRFALLFGLAVSLHASPFRYERNVTPGGTGPNRLDPDIALLAKTQPDLRDLRLFSGGRELGYLLVESKTEPRWIDGAILPIASTKKASGFELDLGRIANVDRVRLGGIATPYLKHVTIEGSGDRAHWTLLADATVFDLPESQLRRDEVEIAAGEYRYLRVVWDDRSSAPAMATNVSVREHSIARAEPLRFAAAFAKRASEPGKSRYRITLPGPHLQVEAIEVEVASGDVFRAAAVTEPRLGNGEVIPTPLGSATLKRAEREGLVAAEMSITIAPPQGRELDLVLDDANNPPLAITAIRARMAPQPWIYFESPDGAPIVARYGYEQAKTPLYDLEASRPYVAKRAVAHAAWGGITNPAIAKSEETLAIPLGGTLDRERFHVRRRIPAAPAGLTVLVLDAHVLARPEDLADVRIADEAGRQVPYLVERRAEPLVIRLTMPARTAQGASSVYRVALPYESWPAETRLVLTTNARVFERNVEVRTVADNHRNRRAETLAFAPWRTADPELLPPPLSIEFSGRRARAIEIVIDEGDNAPLPIVRAEMLVPSYALRFHHPGTPLDLLYGNRRVGPPRYDIALLAPRLFGERANEVLMPPYGAAETGEDDGAQRKLFWGGIIVAAVVLIAMLMRLLLASPETSRAPSDST